MPLGILIVLVQIAFAIHAVKTGKDRYWLWIIIAVPVHGCAIYFITQFGPDAANRQTARHAKKRLIGTIDPRRELRNRMEQLERTDTVENKVALAEQCMEIQLYDDAISLLKNSLRGLNENDPHIMTLLAKCEFENDDPTSAAGTLEALIHANPNYESVHAHLLYARALEGMGNDEAAVREYDVLSHSYPGEEARVRYGLLLKRLRKREESLTLFGESLTRARLAPAHYRRKEKEWLRTAKRESQ